MSNYEKDLEKHNQKLEEMLAQAYLDRDIAIRESRKDRSFTLSLAHSVIFTSMNLEAHRQMAHLKTNDQNDFITLSRQKDSLKNSIITIMYSDWDAFEEELKEIEGFQVGGGHSNLVKSYMDVELTYMINLLKRTPAYERYDRSSMEAGKSFIMKYWDFECDELDFKPLWFEEEK